jgi:hypothetical protein
MTRLSVTVLFVLLSLTTFAVPAFAWQSEGGYKNCGSLLAYTQARFNTYGRVTPPGSAYTYIYSVSGWSTKQVNGAYAGNWSAIGDPYLDLVQTFAGCRSYG